MPRPQCAPRQHCCAATAASWAASACWRAASALRCCKPLEIEEINLAGSRARGAQLLFLVPWLALVGAVVGAISVAIDVTAGERERGSLEPLLMNPVATGSIVLGKWAVAATCSAAVVVLTLAGFTAAMQFVRSENLSALMQFGLPEVVLFLALLLPFSAMVGALNMLAATYGRSHKEAQTYASYITMIVNFVPILPLFLTIRDAPWQLAVPALAQQTVLMRALRGEAVGPIDILAPGRARARADCRRPAAAGSPAARRAHRVLPLMPNFGRQVSTGARCDRQPDRVRHRQLGAISGDWAGVRVR